ncbi:hypothetical protein SY83_02140 [Paenibacillus swuensis]|uniref:Beta-amylase n=1 Tax=Paenibacillus swuensis TaxID=1178515 RepID=A0A172TE62_9BACL|nr:family 14 glycosylhydrolase [Paenibacillus swuensis]ANE45328.1 hypothetical protein SY83_02140 [Paenibacillus swuensis]
MKPWLKNQALKRFMPVSLAILLMFTLIITVPQPTASASMNAGYKTFVMAPLNLPTTTTDWNNFKNQLITLKNNGFAAVTTDVWWGKFEPTNNGFVWNDTNANYLKLAQTVQEAGMKWIPILSFHQCGGNVGDDCNIPLPSWVWSGGTADDRKFKSEQGNYSNEYLSIWYSGAYTQYEEAMQSFKDNFLTSYGSIIEKIYISMGPAGELRYPSYNSHDSGCGYPNRGCWQSFSTPAKNDFIASMQALTGSNLATLNTRWGSSLTNWNQVSPPTDGNTFWTGNGVTSQYGKDYLNWYQGELLAHFDTFMTKAHTKLDAFGVRIGAKVAGVHWKGAEVSGNTMLHSAEQPAGYYNYDQILQKFKDRNADLTFTCLESQNSTGSPVYSYAKDLVIKVADIAKAKGVNIFGENALAFSGDTGKYEQVAEHLFNRNFKGYTHLRMDTFVNSTGGATSDMGLIKPRIVLTPKAITFTVSGVPITSGDEVYISGGNCSGCTDSLGWELGKWQPVTPYMTQMTSTGTAGQYRVTIQVHNNRNYEFKAVKRSSGGTITWESGSNNGVNTSSASAANWTW